MDEMSCMWDNGGGGGQGARVSGCWEWTAVT